MYGGIQSTGAVTVWESSGRRECLGKQWEV